MRTLEFVAPANMENLGQLRSWPLGEPLAADHVDVHIDLRRWRRVTPNPVVGLIAVAAYHARQGHRIRITYPDADYARRMLGTVGFLEALQTFATWTDAAGSVGKVERILPRTSRVTICGLAPEFEQLVERVVERRGVSSQFRFMAVAGTQST